MWTMGYNDPDSCTGRKLRPLIPRLPAAVNGIMTSSSSSPTPQCVARIHAPDHFFALNHHLATVAEQNKRDQTFHMQPSSVVVSSRWNPTPEQLRTLEELYRRGTRTPSAEQIQHITSQLRRYGKIEGKNVFYWFQNHKARERQKRRRQMECPSPQDQYDQDNIMLLDRKDDNNSSGGSSRVAGFEVEQNKNTSTHCTNSPPEEANSMSTKAAASMAEPCRTDIHGWVQCDQRELQQQQLMMRRNATWQTIPARVTPPTTSTAIPTILSTKGLTKASSNYQEYLNIFITRDHHRLLHPNSNAVDYDCDGRERQDHDQTLELFPLRSENGTAATPAACTNQKLMMSSAMDATSYPPNYQFFEFLPLKN